ncbi:MAG: winged helix DNA-binding domain-containing protein [candidate division WOR-3 bacterium]|nr:MAG: winged helix DNA-binding domain-containing protein [candidate division WOR-3 bacterium]
MRRISLKTIEKKRWLLDKNIKIFRVEEAREFVERLGLVSALSNGVLPSLQRAIYTDDLRSRFEADQRLWDFIHVLINRKWAFYGRVLGGQNTVISMKLLPSFLRVYPIPDYRKMHEKGMLSNMARSVMDLLMKHGPLMTHEIRDRMGIGSQAKKRQSNQALVELQRKQLVCCAGKIAFNKYRWRFALWSATEQWLPEETKVRARMLSSDEAKRKLIEKYIYAMTKTTAKKITQFFNMSLNEVNRIVCSMIDKELVSSYNHKGETYLFKGNL